uniref:Beta-lactamase n=1 Tax=Ditylum brightwellii TaxID=49249 RepID=A0A6S8YAL9_9STRA|mmetsp:Transcript_20504/g.30075  ORF Transcript_20504/g.30075 Transcript_20504/m.30075 type:complete len:362 (+) Transcript_20504:158-1243(+)
MGASQSNENTSATISSIKNDKKSRSDNGNLNKESKLDSKVLTTPILMDDDESNNGVDNNSDPNAFPVPTGKEYDLMDSIAADLPAIIDDESKAQVEEYIAACDNGNGPMVACYSTAEYLSLFLRKHKEAASLYENTCFRSNKDKSPNGIEVDGTKAYAPSCFNLAQMRMTGKGNTKFSREEGYKLFDRACRAGHGGSCHMQAKMLASYPGSMGKGVPYDPVKASELYDRVCNDMGDSLSCFALATMLLRGDMVSAEADNVTPQEARGLSSIISRKNEQDRKKSEADKRKSLKRDPIKAQHLLKLGCDRGHAPSCYNLAVMFTQGDEGVDVNEEEAERYKAKTEEMVKRYGGLEGFGGGPMQ